MHTLSALLYALSLPHCFMPYTYHTVLCPTVLNILHFYTVFCPTLATVFYALHLTAGLQKDGNGENVFPANL